MRNRDIDALVIILYFALCLLVASLGIEAINDFISMVSAAIK